MLSVNSIYAQNQTIYVINKLEKGIYNDQTNKYSVTNITGTITLQPFTKGDVTYITITNGTNSFHFVNDYAVVEEIIADNNVDMSTYIMLDSYGGYITLRYNRYRAELFYFHDSCYNNGKGVWREYLSGVIN